MDLKNIARTQEGYLQNINDWQETMVITLAKEEQLIVTQIHKDIVLLLRQFYLEYQHHPKVRIFIKLINQELGSEVGNSSALHNLFPNGLLKQACKLAGLPKPPHCI